MQNADEAAEGFPGTQEQLHADLELLKPLLEELTGLVSRWNGNVVMVPNAVFKGLKPYACDIRIGDRFLTEDERWTTLPHELLHSLSVGYNRIDFENNVGWEEGVVEKLQRLLRSQILLRLSVNIDPELLLRLDTGHPFNRYIEALEQIRNALATEELPFYLKLLQTPIRERYSSLLQQAMQLSAPQRLQALTTLSSANQILTRGRKEGL